LDKILQEKKDLQELRKLVFITGYKGGMAHLASCYSCLEMLYTLYLKDVLRYNPDNPGWAGRDRFILSKGHAGLALYGVMLKAGLIKAGQFKSYLTEKSLIGGEPCPRDSQWVEAASGSLGHGLSQATGMAMALKMNHNPAKVYCMLGDGECEEGTVWEAAISATAFSLDNLIAIIDCNKIQKMDYVEKITGTARWHEKWQSFGWDVAEADGHNTEDFKNTLSGFTKNDHPKLVIAHTVKGKGVSIMENSAEWHFRMPNKKELKIFKEELGITDSELE